MVHKTSETHFAIINLLYYFSGYGGPLADNATSIPSIFYYFSGYGWSASRQYHLWPLHVTRLEAGGKSGYCNRCFGAGLFLVGSGSGYTVKVAIK